MRVLKIGLAGLSLAMLASGAAGADVRGRLQVQQQWQGTDTQSLQAAEGVRNPALTSGDLRLMGTVRHGALQAAVHDQLYLQHGSAVTLDQRLSQAGLPDPGDNLRRSNLWDLDQSWVSGTRTLSGQRLDRLWAGYTGRHAVLRIGRQALTWGGGQVFHPMDLIDPFSPTATDTEYKPGADMLYGQWLFDDGSDIQAVTLPRRDPASRDLQGGRGVSAIYWHHAGYPLQANLLLAHDHGDTVLGANLTGSAGGASWSASLIPTLERDGRTRLSLDANISDGFRLWNRDATGFVEYYRNGFGVGGSGYTLAELPADLQVRLDRGQIFNTGIDYLAAGGTLALTPLWQLEPVWIINLQDRSSLAMLKATDSVAQNTDLVLGLQQPFGGHGTEFGGLALAPGSGNYLETPALIYVRVDQYF